MIYNFFRRFLLVIISSMLLSCSAIKITSNSKIPIKLDADEHHQKEVVIKVDKKFYLWGLIPDEHVLYVDEVVDEAGFEAASGITITETRETSDTILSLLSFGLYLPKTYSISIFTQDD